MCGYVSVCMFLLYTAVLLIERGAILKEWSEKQEWNSCTDHGIDISIFSQSISYVYRVRCSVVRFLMDAYNLMSLNRVIVSCALNVLYTHRIARES